MAKRGGARSRSHPVSFRMAAALCVAEWRNGPKQWTTIDSCNGNEQSPINIVTNNTQYNKDLKPFNFSGYDSKNNFNLTNNGHSAELSFEGGTEITISGGGLEGTYKAAQLHFHWGNSDMLGSEHSIDGERYAAELHIVHKKDSSRSDTSGGTTGGKRTIAVLGFFIEESANDNPKYNGIVQALNDITLKGKSTTVSQVKLQELIPEAKDLKHFYRYDGSLTTPGCDESVTWTVFHKKITLGKSQLQAFYTKLNYSMNAVMVENFRPIQKLNVRTVYTSVSNLEILPITALPVEG
ncbi:PREDICTED: carbonic anhydrase 4-like [Nanorana parkeri]|uniref:carbonic anhydrase 4-like n=1 Tax=Nanorana parkeri TaxID=125878 RepID=UPI0008541E3F|nr:PREDICTED: carbonic anhydrase 4-like [Nanorana parkeri]